MILAIMAAEMVVQTPFQVKQPAYLQYAVGDDSVEVSSRS